MTQTKDVNFLLLQSCSTEISLLFINVAHFHIYSSQMVGQVYLKMQVHLAHSDPANGYVNNSFTSPPHFWKSFLAKTPLAAMQNATGKLLAAAWGFLQAVHWGTLVRKCCRTEQQCPTCISHPLLWPAWWGGQVYLSASFGTLRKNFLIPHHCWKVDVNGSKAFLGHQFKPGEGSQTIVDLQ